MTRPDPAIIDHPITGRVEVEKPSGWATIIVATIATAAVIYLTWNGVLFG